MLIIFFCCIISKLLQIILQFFDCLFLVPGKHEEKPDEHGHIYRHFIRRYTLPKNTDMARIESKLSSDGVLTITAPRMQSEIEHKSIPITQTGEPAKAAAPQPDEQKEK